MAGALQSPCCNTRLTIFLSGVVIAERSTCSGIILICSYAAKRLRTVLNGFIITQHNTPLMSGKGEDIFTVFLFLSHRSNTVLSSGAFLGLCGFGIRSIGTVFLAIVTFHLPDLIYASLFSFHWFLKTSGHQDGLHG